LTVEQYLLIIYTLREVLMDWDKLFEDEVNIEKEPSPIIVDYIEKAGMQKGARILDVGCGPGRHTVYMAKNGFRAYGLDSSETALSYAKRWAKHLNLDIRIVRADMEAIPCREGLFDAIICFGVISHGTMRKIEATLKEIRRVLKDEGTALLTFLDILDFKKGRGEEIEQNTFMLNSGKEEGILHHFSSKIEVENLLRDFKLEDLWLDEAMVEYDGKTVTNRHWVARIRNIIRGRV